MKPAGHCRLYVAVPYSLGNVTCVATIRNTPLCARATPGIRPAKNMSNKMARGIIELLRWRRNFYELLFSVLEREKERLATWSRDPMNSNFLCDGTFCLQKHARPRIGIGRVFDALLH